MALVSSIGSLTLNDSIDSTRLDSTRRQNSTDSLDQLWIKAFWGNFKTAEAGNKTSCEAGMLYVLQSYLEMGRFRDSLETRKC